ncbi:MAG: SRPBCC family protein [Myxococcaceae bacterium]
MTALLVVLALVALFLVVAATRRAEYRIERQVEIATPPAQVSAVLEDVRRFASVLFLFGDPFDQRGSDLKKTVEGAVLSWEGNEAGRGSMRVDESTPGQRAVLTVQFVKPMESTARYEFTLSTTPGGTSVTCALSGRHNFLGKAFSVLMNMDKMLGADVDKTLGELKRVLEASR